MKKNGVTLIALVLTVIIMAILVSVVVLNMNDENIIDRAEDVVDVTRFKELQYAVNDIISDYQLLEESDATIRGKSLEEYIIERLKRDYGLTEGEEAAIEIDGEGNLIRTQND